MSRRQGAIVEITRLQAKKRKRKKHTHDASPWGMHPLPVTPLEILAGLEGFVLARS